MARIYHIKGRQFSKVADTIGSKSVHVVELGNFWKGNRSWLHRAMCGKSVGGVPVSMGKVTCKKCRKAIEDMRGE